jgi:hypothetical protein
MANTVTVTSETTKETFKVRLLATGDRYGLTNSLTAMRPMVEFYDAKYAGDVRFGEHGQFVARYDLETLLDRDQALGLDMRFGEPYWKIDAKALDQALTGLLAGRRDLP